MKKQKSKSAAQKRKAKAKMKAREEDKNRPNWVQDRLDWVEVAEYYSEYEHHESDIDDKKTEEYRPQCASDEGSGSDDSEDDPRFNVSIVSWNVLADSYCSRSSHKNLPSKSQSRVFNRNQRQHQVRQILRLFDEKLSPDLVALQEVDPPLEVAKCMKSLGYGVVETVSSPGGRVGRVDSCGLYFREETWNCLNHETVFLDDLAILRSATDCDDKRNDNTKKSNPSVQSKSSNSGSLKGLERSFVRKNVALLTRLVHERTKQEIIVVVAHLFWNPSYEYVKLCQAHYIAKRAIHFRGEDATVPILWCGDFNSQPNGHVHQYITKGVVNAKEAAPWYKLSRKQSKNNSDLSREAFGRLSISERKNPTIADEQEEHPVQVRYLLDYTLNRFCRWLRILGIDAALETEEEERERTKDGKISIFQRCKEEKRSLVTTASKLLNRKDCPPGTYLLDTKSLLNLESAIVHMLLSHGVVLEPKNTLSRCVVCNGSIEPVNDEEKKQKIFRTYQAPEEINDEIMDVYQCNGCSQGYWWCEKPTSSASRVKSQAQRLLELCIMGGVPFKGDLGMFDYIDVDGLRNRRDTGKNCEDQLQVIRWLQSEYLRNPLQNMTSAYAAREMGEEMLQFTNVTYDFVGHLDYILYPSKEMEVTNLLYVPDSFQALNDLNVSNGHLLPSFDWPSDHLAIGCCLSLRQSGQNHGANSIEQTSVDPKADNVFQESTGQSNQNFQVLSHHDGHHHEHQDGHHSDILGEDNHDSSQDHHRVHQHDQQRDHLHDHNSAQDLRSSGHHDHRHEKECHHHHDHSTADSHDKSHDHHHDHQHNQQQDHHHNDNSAHNHSHNHGGSHDHQHDHHHGHNHDSGHDHQHDHHHGHIHDSGHDHQHDHHHGHNHDSGHDHQHDHHHGHNHDSGHDHQHDHHHGHNHDSGHDHQHDHHHDTNGAASNNRVERCTFFDGPKGPAPFPPGPPSSPPWCSFIASDAKPREPPQKLGTSPDPNGSNESKSSALPEGGCMMVNGICVCYGMGCLPKTPSLFEMAELRRQYRLKLQNGG